MRTAYAVLFLYKENPQLGWGFKKAYGYTAQHKNSFWCIITLRSGNCEEYQKEVKQNE